LSSSRSGTWWPSGPMTRPREKGEAIRRRNAGERRRFAGNETPARGRRDR
jgi:hypothetical protein